MSEARGRRPSDRTFAAATRARAADMDRLNARLASGRITPDEWADGFHAILVRGHTDAHVLGRQRAGDLSGHGADDHRFGLDAADGQGDFLARFVAQIKHGDRRLFDEEGRLNEGAMMVRTRQYATRFRGTANQAFVDAGETDDEYDWVLGPTEHCPDCLDLAGLSPYTESTVISHPGDGGTDCKVNCACRWVRRRGNLSGFGRADVFASDEEPDAETPATEPSATPVSDMDPQSRELFASPAEIESAPPVRDLARVTRLLFDRAMSAVEMADAVAAPAGANVTVDCDDSTVRVTVVHEDLDIRMDRVFQKDPKGRTWAYHEYFRADGAPPGTGLRIFARQVARYEGMGIHRIETDAAGSPGDTDWIGYYVWPRFGYNMEIPAGLRAAMKRDGIEAKDLNELFVAYGDKGAAWWKANGRPGHMVYDMEAGSASRLLLESYAKRAGARAT